MVGAFPCPNSRSKSLQSGDQSARDRSSSDELHKGGAPWRPASPSSHAQASGRQSFCLQTSALTKYVHSAQDKAERPCFLNHLWNVCVHVCACVGHVCTCAWVCECMHERMHVGMCVCMSVHGYMGACVYARVNR